MGIISSLFHVGKLRLARTDTEHSQHGDPGLSPKLVPTRLEKTFTHRDAFHLWLPGWASAQGAGGLCWLEHGLTVGGPWTSYPSNEEVGEDKLELLSVPPCLGSAFR